MSTKPPDERQPETFDGATGIPDPTPAGGAKPPRRIDLSSLRDVRLEIAAVYRAEDCGDIDTHRATRKVWMLRELANVITLAELEKRIQELEERQAGAGALSGNRILPAPTLN